MGDAFYLYSTSTWPRKAAVEGKLPLRETDIAKIPSCFIKT